MRDISYNLMRQIPFIQTLDSDAKHCVYDQSTLSADRSKACKNVIWKARFFRAERCFGLTI